MYFFYFVTDLDAENLSEITSWSLTLENTSFGEFPNSDCLFFSRKTYCLECPLDMKREYPDIGAHNYEYDDDDDYSDGDEYTDDSEYSEEYTESDDDDHHVETLNEKLETVTIVPPEVTNNEC